LALLAAAGCADQDQETLAPSTNGEGDNSSAANRAETTSGQLAPDSKHPVVVIETSLGNITVELDAENTPITVNNFLSYVDDGHYDQTIFHQVSKEYPQVVIGGAFAPDLTEKPTRTPIYNEANDQLKNRRGTIAMARQPDAIHSATCHFFFNLTDNEVLDQKDRTLEGYGYCVFGKVVDGMDVVDNIGNVEVHNTEQFERIPVRPVVITSIRRL
jgi:cyclophilin family peptidyl-prolyl cis-trans isomerase